MFVLGLTGSIGMGKSAVGSMFMEEGVPLLDADQVVHELYAMGGAAVSPVGDAFPGVIVDGAIDRKLLSQHVLGAENSDNMKRLEAIVHPLVGEERRQFVAKHRDLGHSLVVLDIPLLYETKAEGSVDGVCVVSAPPEKQRERVLARPGMTEEKFRSILSRQVADEEKRKRADYVIDTGGTMQESRAQVKALIAKLTPDR